MTKPIRTFGKIMIEALEQKIQTSEAETLVKYFLLEHTSSHSTDWLLNKEVTIDEATLQSVCEKLAQNTPVQYILGQSYFDHLKISLIEGHTLIPRPETLELCQLILKQNADNQTIKALDICTGSGAIAIYLADQKKKWQVSGFDIDPQAVECAKNNALTNCVNINFYIDDVFKLASTSEKWDIIVSNPPYIPTSEKSSMHANVLNFEPLHALFVPDETPLIFYEKIALFALKQLNPKGKLYFEIHENYGEILVGQSFVQKFRDVDLQKDFYGKDRFLILEI